jgi:hypothetical protein
VDKNWRNDEKFNNCKPYSHGLNSALAQRLVWDMNNDAPPHELLQYAVSDARHIPHCGEHGVVEPALDNQYSRDDLFDFPLWRREASEIHTSPVSSSTKDPP